MNPASTLSDCKHVAVFPSEFSVLPRLFFANLRADSPSDANSRKIRALCKHLYANNLQAHMQKTVFRNVKDGKLQRKRPPFAGSKAAFRKTADKHRETHRQQRARQTLMKNNTSAILLYARHGVINTERPLKTSRIKRKTKNDYKRQRHIIHGEGRP